MSNALAERIASLRTLAPEFNGAADDAAQLIKEVDAFLGELGVGAGASRLIAEGRAENPDPDGPTLVESTYLEYGRFRGRFQIHASEIVSEADDDGTAGHTLKTTFFPWSSLSREWKLDSVVALPHLITTIEKTFAAKVAARSEAAASVREMLRGLKLETPGGGSPERRTPSRSPKMLRRAARLREARTAGREWAEHVASDRDLRALELLRDDPENWAIYFDLDPSAHSAFGVSGDLYMSVVNGDADRQECERFWDTQLGDRYPRARIVKAFCDGALAVRDEAKAGTES